MKINKKALLLGTMAFVLVAASGMVSAYARVRQAQRRQRYRQLQRVCALAVWM